MFSYYNFGTYSPLLTKEIYEDTKAHQNDPQQGDSISILFSGC